MKPATAGSQPGRTRSGRRVTHAVFPRASRPRSASISARRAGGVGTSWLPAWLCGKGKAGALGGGHPLQSPPARTLQVDSLPLTGEHRGPESLLWLVSEPRCRPLGERSPQADPQSSGPLPRGNCHLFPRVPLMDRLSLLLLKVTLSLGKRRKVAFPTQTGWIYLVGVLGGGVGGG